MTPSVEDAIERFFIDHGMIHDRVTGKHVSTEPIEFAEGEFDASPTLEACALLNALSTLERPAEKEIVGWQPIETAPRDGGYIIAGKFGRSRELAWVKHSRWITEAEICELEGYGSPGDFDAGWTDGNDDSEPCFPTHWMPLEPPALEAARKQS